MGSDLRSWSASGTRVGSIARQLGWIGVLLLAGCQPEGGSQTAEVGKAAPAPPPPLRVLVLGDPDLAKKIQREWTARADGDLTLREATVAEFYSGNWPRLAADAVIFPTEILGDLASRDWLAPFSEKALDDPAVQRGELFSSLRRQELVWGDQTVAAPLGSAPWVLWYRRDILTKWGVAPPRTWTEYQALVGRLADPAAVQEFLPAGAEPTWWACCEPIQGEQLVDWFLARAAPYAKHRSQYSALFDYRTMQPLIAGPPFVRALEELAATASQARFADTLTQAEQLPANRFLAGQCALAICRMPRGEIPLSPALAQLGIAPVPGATDVYNFRSASWETRDAEESPFVPYVGSAGRLAAVTRECRQPASAGRLVLWLTGPEMGATISPTSVATGPFRRSHLQQLDRWFGSNWHPDSTRDLGATLSATLSEPNCLISLRIPDANRYRASLATAIRDVLAGRRQAAAALAAVAEEWAGLSSKNEPEKLRTAYTLSLGIRP